MNLFAARGIPLYKQAFTALAPARIWRYINTFAQLMLCGGEQRIPTHLTDGEKVLLMDLARRCPGTTYVEIGSYLGASSCFIARGISRSRTGGRLFCVDTWMNDAMTEGISDTYHQFEANTQPYGTIVTAIRGRSCDAAVSFNDEIDFLFIDGDHSYAGVVADIQAWFPKLSQDTMVIFHDYAWAEGVQQAVEEFVKPVEKTPGRLIENTYWAIVKRK
jgi:predicted O-methyltransferase YrrM